jgi:hypothetical protein
VSGEPEEFCGKKKVSINQIHQYGIEDIIIFSFYHQEEIEKKIINQCGDRYRIHKIYDEDREPVDGKEYLALYKKLIMLEKAGKFI